MENETEHQTMELESFIIIIIIIFRILFLKQNFLQTSSVFFLNNGGAS